MLIRGAEIEGRAGLDLRIEGERVTAIGSALAPRPGELQIDAAGGALLPGLHDHHLHLQSLAAAQRSVPCGPPQVRDAHQLAAALADATPSRGWLRGVGYHESVAGHLDRARLDALGPDGPVRIQHRSGAAWMLNSAGLRALGLEGGEEPARGEMAPAATGVERDGCGRPTGFLYGLDGWLRQRLPPGPAPDLSRVGRWLARCGVTGATDATPDNGCRELAGFEAAVRRDDLPQRLLLMGSAELPAASHPRLARGPVKLMLRQEALPEFQVLERQVRAAHAAGRAVAFHCVTRAEVLLATALLEAAGCRAGDRLEHASLAPPEAVERIAKLGVTVVTQPGFLYERGDDYWRDVEVAERPWLYRGQGFLDAGVALGAGSDAPFGQPDPWLAMQSAVRRESAGGRLLGAGERLSPERALALFTSPLQAPGGPPRRVRVGAVADLCLLDRPWREAREQLSRDAVAATFVAGRLRWRASAW